MVERFKRLEAYSTYGITEIAAAFSECGRHKGLHSHPDLVYPEVVDESGSPVKDGEMGELVVTTFRWRACRFCATGQGTLHSGFSEPCACGRNSIRIGPITGRKAHRLKIKHHRLSEEHRKRACRSRGRRKLRDRGIHRRRLRRQDSRKGRLKQHGEALSSLTYARR